MDNCTDVQKVRKELKEWESAFNLVHRRKPLKEDIDKAPPDIKEKYKVYFHMRKGSGLSKGNEESQREQEEVSKLDTSQSEVWGVEFNKKQIKAKETKDESGEDRVSSLDELGSKLFSNASHEVADSLSKDAKKKKNIMRACDVTLPTSTSTCLKSEANERNKVTDIKECPREKLFNLAGTTSDPQEDFSLTGNIFKQAQKMTKIKNKNISNVAANSNKEKSQPILGMKFSMSKKRSISSTVSIDVSRFENFDEVDGESDDHCLFTSSLNSSSVAAADSDSQSYGKPDKKMGKDSKAGNFSASLSSPSQGNQNNEWLQSMNSNNSKTNTDTLSCSKSADGDVREVSGNSQMGTLDSDREIDGSTKNLESGIVKRKARSSGYLDDNSSITKSTPSVSTPRDEVHKESKLKEKRQADRLDEGESTQPSKRLRPTLTDAGDDGWLGKRDDEEGDVSTDLEQKSIPSAKNITVSSSAGKSSGPARKRSAASMNENYICLNMKKKGYRRKGGGMTAVQLKRKQWKNKMSARSQSYGSNKCFKCGQEGHWANKCKGKATKAMSDMTPESSQPVDESDFPSLRDAVMMARGVKASQDH